MSQRARAFRSFRFVSLAAFVAATHVHCTPAPPAVSPTPGADAAAASPTPAPTPSADSDSSAGAGDGVALTPSIKVRANAPWVIGPPTTRNFLEVRRNDVQVNVVAEARTDHAAALVRLAEITTDFPEPVEWRAVSGWPAFVQRGKRKLAYPNNMPPPNPPDATVITITIAVDDTIVRFEATLLPGAGPNVVTDLIAVANALQCATAPAGQTDRDLAQLKARKR